MAVFIETRTEPFEMERRVTEHSLRNGGRRAISVRRPTRGFQAKQNTYAVIRVMGSNGRFIPVIDAAGDEYSVDTEQGTTTQYSNFFIQSVSEQRHEKQQIVETFGDSWIFFFGESPVMWNVQGFLLNTADFNWRAEWWENYERYFRGTRLVELGARLYVMYDDLIVEGYMVAASSQESAAPTPEVLPFNFQMFVTGYSNVSRIGDPNFPAPTDLDYAQLSSYDKAIQNWQKNRNLQKQLYTDPIKQASFSAKLGTGKMIARTIRDNIINAGDPSIGGFVARAARALKIQNYPDRPQVVTAGQRGMRTAPLRGRFADNIDEFIGIPDNRTAQELANPLSMADRWLEMDRHVDNGLSDIISSSVDIGKAVFDVMGRAGRASISIRAGGGSRNQSQRVGRGQIVGQGNRSNQRRQPRSKPFGMKVVAGGMR